MSPPITAPITPIDRRNYEAAKRLMRDGTERVELPGALRRAYTKVERATIGADRQRARRLAEMSTRSDIAEGVRQSYTMNQVDDQSLRVAGRVNAVVKAHPSHPVVMAAGGFNDACKVAQDDYEAGMQDAFEKGDTMRAALNFTGSFLTSAGRYGNGVTDVLDSESSVSDTRRGLITTGMNVGLGAIGRGAKLELTEAQAARFAPLTKPIQLSRGHRPAPAVIKAPTMTLGPKEPSLAPTDVFGRPVKSFESSLPGSMKATEYLERNYKGTVDALSRAERDALTRYKETSGPFNHGLRNGTVSAEYAPMVDNLEKAIGKSRLVEDTMVSRTVDARVFDAHAKGGVFEDAAFTSTRITDTIVTDPSKVTLRIMAPKGARALYVDPVNGGMRECELLLPPGAKLQVLKDVAATAEHGRVVYAKLINP